MYMYIYMYMYICTRIYIYILMSTIVLLPFLAVRVKVFKYVIRYVSLLEIFPS